MRGFSSTPLPGFCGGSGSRCVLVGPVDLLCRARRPVEEEGIHLDGDLVRGARLLVFMVDVLRGGVHLCGKARRDDVEQFAHQDSRHGVRAFEETPQDIKRFRRCDGFGGFSDGADGLCCDDI